MTRHHDTTTNEANIAINVNVIKDPDANPKPYEATKRKISEVDEVFENFETKVEISENKKIQDIPKNIRIKHAVLKAKKIARPVKYKTSGVKTTFLLGKVLIN